MFLGSTLTAICAGVAFGSVGPIAQAGVFALLGGTPKIVSKFRGEHAAGSSVTLTIRQFQLDGKTSILNYDVDMQKFMHLVVVRDDFATFAHLHPVFDTRTGVFWQPFTKEPNHRYYVYADTMPRGIGQQVFRFTLESDGPVAASRPVWRPSTAMARVGPYTVTLSRTTLPANRAKNVNVTVLEGAQPARDLGTYLGAAAHAVFIDTSTLAYAHVHLMLREPHPANTGIGMDMGDAAGPFMHMRVPPLPAGTYKLWIQLGDANGKLTPCPSRYSQRSAPQTLDCD